jgi:N-acetylglucosamine kinase-like BadF-type ATPase
LLLAGTGAIALGRGRRGPWSRAGGLGPLLGDDGSAFSIGRAWLRSSSVPPARARRIATAPDAVARVAALAPAVLRRARKGDRTAKRIVRVAQHALADLVHQAAPRGRPRQGIPVSWAGGLLTNQNFRVGVWRELRRRGVRITPVAPRATATTPSAWLDSLVARGLRSGLARARGRG